MTHITILWITSIYFELFTTEYKHVAHWCSNIICICIGIKLTKILLHKVKPKYICIVIFSWTRISVIIFQVSCRSDKSSLFQHYRWPHNKLEPCHILWGLSKDRTVWFEWSITCFTICFSMFWTVLFFFELFGFLAVTFITVNNVLLKFEKAV